MMTSPNGNGVIVIGGYNDSLGEDSNLIFEIKSGSNSWTQLKLKLQYARVNHVSIPFPGVLYHTVPLYCTPKL